MYYSYIEIEYVATSFSPARTDLALKLLRTEKEHPSASSRKLAKASKQHVKGEDQIVVLLGRQHN
jgi:hypothetical protein